VLTTLTSAKATALKLTARLRQPASKPYAGALIEGNVRHYYLSGASGEFLYAVGDNLRQLHYLLAQFGVFLNVALNTIAIGL
jgi:hypothetical protein